MADLHSLTGLTTAPSFTLVRRYPTAIPQLVVGHLEKMETIRRRLEDHPGLSLAGNYLKGVGIKDAVMSGIEAASSVLARRQPGS